MSPIQSQEALKAEREPEGWGLRMLPSVAGLEDGGRGQEAHGLPV